MCDSTLAIYCFIDDFLKQSGHKEDIRIEVTDAEIITIAAGGDAAIRRQF